MPDKKKNTKIALLTKEDLIGYIGPVFEELKGNIFDLRTELKGDTLGLRTELKGEIKQEARRLEVLLDANKREILGALETFFAVSAKEETVKNHEERISHLEMDVKVVKAAIQHKRTQ